MAAPRAAARRAGNVGHDAVERSCPTRPPPPDRQSCLTVMATPARQKSLDRADRPPRPPQHICVHNGTKSCDRENNELHTARPSALVRHATPPQLESVFACHGRPPRKTHPPTLLNYCQERPRTFASSTTPRARSGEHNKRQLYDAVECSRLARPPPAGQRQSSLPSSARLRKSHPQHGQRTVSHVCVHSGAQSRSQDNRERRPQHDRTLS